MFALVVLFVLLLSLAFLAFSRSSAAGGTRAGSVRRPIKEILDNPEKITYSKVDVPLPPPQVGRKVRFVARLQYSILGKYVLAASNKAKTGLDLLTGEYIPEKATFLPPSNPGKACTSTSNKSVLEGLIKKRDTKALYKTSCVDFYKVYSEGKRDPLEIAHAVLEAIDASNNTLAPPLRAVIECDAQEVLRMAKESATRWGKGEPLSFLDGVPIAIKGQFNVVPYQCTSGCSFQPTCAKNLPESTVVTRLKEAGAVIIGIANMQEAAAGTYGSNPNKTHQFARNPYNTEFFCGGSSSGSAGSVCAGLCPIAMGSDDGGSIRIPAAFCGVYGLKPTYGLLDKTGFAPISHTVGVVGPLASSAVDIAVAMDIMCPDKAKLNLNDLTKVSIEGIRVGVYWEYFEHADEEVVEKCKSALDTMTSLGAVCRDIKIPELLEMKVAHLATALVEFGSSLALDVDNRFGELSAETLSMVGLGYTYSGTDYINCQKQRTRTVYSLKRLFNEVDVIVTPMVPIVAPKIPTGATEYGLLSNEYVDVSIRFTGLANLSGIPSIAIPVGLSSSGLPISLQIMAPWFEEGRLLQIANVLESKLVSDSKQSPLPSVYFDILEKH